MLQSSDGVGHTSGVGAPSEHATNKTGSLCARFIKWLFVVPPICLKESFEDPLPEEQS